MGGCIQHFRIMGEVTAEHDQKLQRLIRYVVRHRAVQAIEADALLKIVTRGLVNGFAQQRQRLRAVSALRKLSRSFSVRACGGRSLCRRLREREPGCRQNAQEQKRASAKTK